MTTALFTHPDCLEHINPPGAPEQVARLSYVLEALKLLELAKYEAPKATTAQLKLAHAADYVDKIPSRIPNDEIVFLDPDTYVSPTSMNAILRAAGGAVAATNAVLDGGAHNAFVATRPPGHHCNRRRASSLGN